jgi:hypothetical protein
MSPAEWRSAAEARLAELGVTYEELAARVRAGEETLRERKLWLLIRDTLGEGSADA